MKVQAIHTAGAFDRLMIAWRIELVETDPAHPYKVWRLVCRAGDLERLAALD